ncbi:arsR-family transcriptional regulator [Roseobacter sp. SK209-2-6]|uniref:ArsR/SmtB family transcription factor n=1 Tax=Roseobacter sp. SK209-2-6 TaxID=388739 RepID=UPI0000F3CDE3|nr:metalloregulator ArsR/SmtB family transcription factor [Roseobacter sp. SK209-2-6]EBA14776.1 arsR-family transcriptional regulator [Roseobacter sp. SK209-2-6]
MLNPLPDHLPALRALANAHRVQIMDWLLDPEAYFPPQRDGDLVEDGVCVGFITERTELSQPTVTNHMKMLEEAGLVTSKKIKNWVFYKADRKALEALALSFKAASEK